MPRVLLLVGLLLGTSLGPAGAQVPDSAIGQGEGTVALTDWPASLSQLLDEMGTDAPYLLPKLDSLGLNYRHAATDSTSRWSFVLGWTPGQRVLYQGDVLSRVEAPSNVRMVNVELRADVWAGGEKVGDMIVAVDSMALRPFPSVYSFEVEVRHDRVFLDTPAEAARRALAAGVTLRNPVVERMGFTAPEATPQSGRRPDADARSQEPESRPPPSVYEPLIAVRVGWRVAPRPYYVAGRRGGNRDVRPRGAPTGQPTTGDDKETDDGDRSGRGSAAEGDGDGSDDEDEEGPDLGGPALAAAGAVALTAVVGGTVGFYGTGETPLGLSAGYTQPNGGVHLQAAINTAVLRDDADQKLTVKALGFYDLFGTRIQPAAGVGVQVDDDPAPAVSLGLVGNTGPVVLYGGSTSSTGPRRRA